MLRGSSSHFAELEAGYSASTQRVGRMAGSIISQRL